METLTAQDAFINETNKQTQQQGESKTLIKSKKSRIPDYLKEMNVLDKLANQKIIKDMNKRINFLKNPRFRIVRPPIQFRNLEKNPELTVEVNQVNCPFRATPEVVLFKDYMINQLYEIVLTITNIQTTSRRFKYLPPQTEQFTVSNVKYPIAPPKNEYEDIKDKEFGLIAPGMSVELNLQFHSTSFAEFEDKITIICDENVFDIQILAKKEPPSIDLPELLDCKSCWLGDKAEMVFRVKNKGGEAGFKFFSEREEDDAQYVDGDALKLNNFTIYPAEFFIEKNKEIEIYVTYYPMKADICQEKVILACDNQTSAIYTLQGKANTAELNLYGIDNKPYVISEGFEFGGVQKFFFEDVVPFQPAKRSIQIANKTQVNVKYHWALFKQDRKQQQFKLEQDQNFVFKITPEQGYFEPDQIIDFQVQSQTCDQIPVFEFATLFIDDIPYSSIRNPPESLVKQLEQEKAEIQQGRNSEFSVKQPAYFGINSTRPSISYFEFELIALSDYCKTEITPSFFIFPEELYINKQYNKTFKIKNLSKCQLTYSIREHKTTSWEVDSFIMEKEGVINSLEEKEINVGLRSKKVGKNQKIAFIIDYNFAHSQTFEMVANFQGPNISILQPSINFGLFQSFSTEVKTLTIKNTSQIDAEMEFFLESESSLDENALQQQSRQEQNEEDGEDYLWENAYDRSSEMKKGAKIKFIPRSILLSPGEEGKVQVFCEAYHPYSHKDICRIEVKDGQKHFIGIEAEIQDIHISLSRYSFDFECLFAGNVYTFEKGQEEQFIEIQNLGNLPAQFKWNQVITEQYEATFEPESGKIPPKSYFPIKFTLKPKIGGSFDNLFICDILNDEEHPLGFEINTRVLGLSVEYDKLEYLALPQANASLALDKKVPGSNKFKSTFLQKTLKKQTMQQKNMNESTNYQPNASMQSGSQGQEKKYKTEPLTKLNFFGCQINQPKTMYVLIRNTSGIDTKFRVYPEKYLPLLDHEIKSLEDTLSDRLATNSIEGTNKSKVKFTNNTMTSNTMGKSSYRKGRQSIRPQKLPTLITADIEQKNNFTSVQGQQLNAAKRLEKDQRQYLSNNLGIAILCEPQIGKLHAYGEVIVKVSVFNDICGLFDDKLCCEIKGMPLKKFDISMEVSGTPIIVQPNQLGITYKGDFPLYHLGYYMRNNQSVTREFRIQNMGPKEIELEWKVYNLDDDGEAQERTFFDIQITPPQLGSKDIATLNFNPVEPPEAHDGPFLINTDKHLLHGRNEKCYKITFKTDIEKVFNSVIIAKPILKENPDVKIGILAMYLKVETIKPVLHFDKYFTVEGTQKLKFEKWALSENKKETKTFVLINQKPANLIFTVQIFGPFKIIQATTNSPAKHELQKSALTMRSSKGLEKMALLPSKQLQNNSAVTLEPVQTMFNLVPNSNVELKVQFEGPDVKDYDHWPMIEKEYKFGGLNFFFSNGDEQNVELEGRLLRPAIALNTVGHEGFDGEDIQDFGIVHINNRKTISVFLSNKSKVPAQWKLNNIKIKSYKNISNLTQTFMERENEEKLDDPDVFEFSITKGVIYGPSVPVRCMPDTAALPSRVTNQEISKLNQYPQQILINFKPKRNILYKSKFRITVEEGPNVDLILRGRGTYEEHLEKY